MCEALLVLIEKQIRYNWAPPTRICFCREIIENLSDCIIVPEKH